jgi:hypothetical protein
MDEVFRSEFKFDEHDDTIHHVLSQPSEDLILEQNAELRKTPGILRDLGKNEEGGSWGRLVATVPMIIYWKAIKDGYQLNAPNSEFAAKEMHRFLLSEEGKLCLVQG